MNFIHDPLFYAIAIPSVLLTGISKGGFSCVGGMAVALLSLVITAPQAVAIMLPILLVADAFGLVTFRAKVDWRILKVALPAGLLGTFIGWLLFAVVNPNWIKALLGIESVIFATQKLLQGSAAWTGAPQPLQKIKAFLFSTLGGFASFISHSGGPPMMHFLLPMKLDKMILAGTLAWFFATMNFSKLVPYSHLGLLSGKELGTSLVLLPLIPCGYWLGYQMLKKISPAGFVRTMSILLLLTGCKLLWDAGRALL